MASSGVSVPIKHPNRAIISFDSFLYIRTSTNMSKNLTDLSFYCSSGDRNESSPTCLTWAAAAAKMRTNDKSIETRNKVA